MAGNASHRPYRKAAELAAETIPALITGGAGNEPAGMVTYAIVRTTTGFSQLWLLLLSTPMLAAENIMAARVALRAHDGLAAFMALI